MYLCQEVLSVADGVVAIQINNRTNVRGCGKDDKHTLTMITLKIRSRTLISFAADREDMYVQGHYKHDIT